MAGLKHICEGMLLLHAAEMCGTMQYNVLDWVTNDQAPQATRHLLANFPHRHFLLDPADIMAHWEQYNILVPNQHCYRAKRSCESQLIELIDELTKNIDANSGISQ